MVIDKQTFDLRHLDFPFIQGLRSQNKAAAPSRKARAARRSLFAHPQCTCEPTAVADSAAASTPGSSEGTLTSRRVPFPFADCTRTVPFMDFTLSLIPASPNEWPRELLDFACIPTPSSSTESFTISFSRINWMFTECAWACLTTLCNAS